MMNNNKDNNVKELLEVDLNEIVETGKKRKNKNKKKIIIAFVVIILLICICLLFKNVIIPNNNKSKSLSYMKQKKYEQALEIAKKENDSKLKDYILAYKYMMNGEYDIAILKYEELQNYKESRKFLENCEEKLYKEAMDAMDNCAYLPAGDKFKKIVKYKDSAEKMNVAYNLYSIVRFGSKHSKSYFSTNKFKLINDSDELNKIFTDSSWLEEEINWNENKSLGKQIELNSDGTGTLLDLKKSIFWTVKDGQFFYKLTYGTESIDTSKNDDRKEVRKILDDIYLLINDSADLRNDGNVEYIMISKKSKWLPTLEKCLPFIEVDLDS